MPSSSPVISNWRLSPFLQTLAGGQSNSWSSTFHLCVPCSPQISPKALAEENKPVFQAGDPNDEHSEWNSRVNSPREAPLSVFATMKSNFVCGPDVPTTVPSYPTHTPDVLDIVVVKDFVLPVNLTVCSALSSDHFLVIVNIHGRASFQILQNASNE